MDYYLKELLEEEHENKNRKNAGGKARADIVEFFERSGVKPCEVFVDITARSEATGLQKLIWHQRAVNSLKECTAQLHSGDTLYIQFPIICHSIFLGRFFRQLAGKNIRTVLIVHDLESIRRAKTAMPAKMKLRFRAEELQGLRACSGIIVHNDVMKEFLAEKGIDRSKMVPLGVFDYLLPEVVPFQQAAFQRDGNVVVAGNLSAEKCGYLYSLPNDVQWNLYGVGYVGKERQNSFYQGSFTPEELPMKLEGSFGLVWDGTSADTCAGIYGEYLRINNPHKISLYLAAGLPVIIWKEAALADFVEKEGVGLTVSSLFDIRAAIDKLTKEQYETMKENAKRIGMRLRQGSCLHEAIEKLQ